MNISVKITALDSQIDPIDWEGSIAQTKSRLRPIFQRAMAAGAFVNVDMEQYRFKDLTYAIFRSLLDEPEFADVSQQREAYLTYLLERLNGPRAWLKEAIVARQRGPATLQRRMTHRRWRVRLTIIPHCVPRESRRG